MTQEQEQLATRLHFELAEWEREGFAARVLTKGASTLDELRDDCSSCAQFEEDISDLEGKIEEQTERITFWTMKYNDECKRAEGLEERIAELEAAARAVVERWDSPLWKEQEPTAAVIYALRDLL